MMPAILGYPSKQLRMPHQVDHGLRRTVMTGGFSALAAEKSMPIAAMNKEPENGFNKHDQTWGTWK